nr:ribonuclease H-like domain-containing protein [Tanacetum cinerariifolium]
MGKANIVVDAWRRKRGVNPRRDVRTLTLKDAHAMKYFVHPRVSKVWYDLRPMSFGAYEYERVVRIIARATRMGKRFQRLILGRVMDTLSLRLCLLGLHEVKGGARVTFEDEFGAVEEREVSCEAQQSQSGVKRKLFRSFRNKMVYKLVAEMRKDIVGCVCKSLACLEVEVEYQRYDVIWVIVDRLTKLAYFLAIQEDYTMEMLESDVEAVRNASRYEKRLSLMLLEHKDVIEEFCSPSQWKELSKETSSKILPSCDGSCWKTPKSVERAFVLHQPDGVGSKRYHIVPFYELNGVPVAFVASFGVNTAKEFKENMLNYSLWEVILNGDSPTPTRFIKGVVQPLAPTTAKQRLARKNKLKAHGTLLMALPDKHELKFHTHKDAKTLMEAIEKSFRGNTKSKKKLISQLKILRESLSQEDINLKFLRSLRAEWRTHTLIWRNKTDLEEQSLDDLFNNLKIYEAKRTKRNLGANGPTSMGFDMSKVECYNYHEKGHFARECRYDWSFQADEEPTNYALMAFTSVSSSSDNEVVSCLKACTKAYAKLQTHYDKLTDDYRKSQFDVISYKTGLESIEARLLVYQQNESVFEEYIKLLKLEVQLRDNALVVLRQNLEKAKQEYQSGHRYHAIPIPYTGRFMPPKPDLVFHNAPNNVETVYTAFNVELSSTKPNQDMSPTHRPLAPIIEDWVSDSEDDSEAKILQNNPSFGNPQHAFQDKGVIDSGCSRHMTVNMSYLSDFEELNGRYVTFGRNPNGGKISGKGKIRTRKLDFDDVYFVKELKFNLFSVSQMCDKKNSVLFTDTECLVLSPEFKLPDETQVLLRVLRENNMYNVDLKNIVSSGDLTCLFAKANLMGRKSRGREYLTICAFPVWPSSSTNPQNSDRDDAFDEKESEFKGRKPESEVNVSLSSSAQTKKHDDKTKREVKGKIPTVGQIFTDSTNTFSIAGPSNAVVSPTHGKSSYVDSSQLPDDLNMPELEDITYSDDEEDVGAEADFTNLETTITVNPILITRVHKDHPVTQIIGDLSSATQTRSMTRVAKDQDGLS